MSQEISASVVEGNDSVTGHIISTTIGGKNGETKQVRPGSYVFATLAPFPIVSRTFYITPSFFLVVNWRSIYFNPC